MADRSTTLLCLLCHYLKLLQSCRLPTVLSWSSELLKSILDRINEFQEIVRSLDDEELDALLLFIPQVHSTHFHLPHLGLGPEDLRNSVAYFIRVIANNPDLPKAHRDTIFEHCLDHSIEVPKFSPVSESVLKIPQSFLPAIESRLFGRHLIKLDDKVRIWAFLDFCYTLKPDYLINLLISVLESMIPNTEVTCCVINWLVQAIAKDNSVRVILDKQDRARIRDLSFCHTQLLEAFQ